MESPSVIWRQHFWSFWVFSKINIPVILTAPPMKQLCAFALGIFLSHLCFLTHGGPGVVIGKETITSLTLDIVVAPLQQPHLNVNSLWVYSRPTTVILFIYVVAKSYRITKLLASPSISWMWSWKKSIQGTSDTLTTRPLIREEMRAGSRKIRRWHSLSLKFSILFFFFFHHIYPYPVFPSYWSGIIDPMLPIKAKVFLDMTLT